MSNDGIDGLCMSCGFHRIWHQMDEVTDISDGEDDNEQAPAVVHPRGALGVIPRQWHQRLQFEDWDDVYPAPPYHHDVEELPPNLPSRGCRRAFTPRVSTIFTPHQIQRMMAMANTLGWSLAGLLEDPELDRFCQEIGVPTSQFRNWLNNNRRRYGGGGRGHGRG
uniref:Homeobox domain-containing protein n=1 Tax=Kalanchoe fedtschenkoi TaxID=63787 RepID=A0A7N1A182_KALFE